MYNALKNVLNARKEWLANNKIRVSFSNNQQQWSYSANLDSARYVGTISYWSENLFEFQFNSCSSGNVVFLETREFKTDTDLANFIEDLITTKLI